MAAPIDKTNFLEFSGNNLNCKRLQSYEAKKFDQIDTFEYNKFLLDYLVPNRPCIFCPRLTESWKSRKHWVSEDGSPNFDYLRRHFGDTVVPVANCKQEQYSSHPKRDLTLHEYLDYWEAYRDHGYPATDECLYLKDWHFTKVFPEYEAYTTPVYFQSNFVQHFRVFPEYKAYTTPVYFQSDWLNEFWDTKSDDDYRFVYMGPKGTWTPFHSDVYRSFSWSANICGRKKWIFYPPGCEESLRDRFGQLVYDVTSRDLDAPHKFPNAAKVRGQALEVIQERGQVIFVPSGWHHQVYNLEDTISINHNWLNGCNVDISWQHLLTCLRDVKREIADCRDMDGWEQQCQLILNASAGIDYRTFLQLLKVITERRVTYLQDGVSSLDVSNNSATSTCLQDRVASLVISNVSATSTCLQDRVASLDISNNGATSADKHLEVNESKTFEACSRETITLESNTEETDISASDDSAMMFDNRRVHPNDGDSETVETNCNDTKGIKRINTNIVENDVSAPKCTDTTMNCESKICDIAEMTTNLDIDVEKQQIKADGTNDGTCDQCEIVKCSQASESASAKRGDNGYGEMTVQCQESVVAKNDDDHCDKCGKMTKPSMIDQLVCTTSNRLVQETIRRVSETVSEGVGTQHETMSEGVGMQHIEYDLLRVKEVVTAILEDDDYKQLHFDYADSAEYILHLLDNINL